MLKCEYDGEETISHHDSAAVAAEQAWAWAEKAGLEVLSGEWEVRTAKYGWQDAYNTIVSKEGQNWEPQREFLSYVLRSLSGSKFEAHGQASRITLEKSA